jgi:hypothetical protein
MARARRIVLGLAGLALAGFLVIQVLPLGSFVWWLNRNENPPVLATINSEQMIYHLLTTTCPKSRTISSCAPVLFTPPYISYHTVPCLPKTCRESGSNTVAPRHIPAARQQQASLPPRRIFAGGGNTTQASRRTWWRRLFLPL